jgi:large subunit ribosomal protein L22
MEVKAKLRFVKIAPRKLRLLADLVRGKQVQPALDQLQFSVKRGAMPFRKLILSAMANATNNFDLAANNLYIKEITVDQGPVMKRWLPRAHGRATILRKKMSHVNLTLGEVKDSGIKTAKQQKIEAPVRLGEKQKEDDGIKIADKDKTLNEAKTGTDKEQNKEIVDPRGEGRGKNTRLEGGKGFSQKVFRRKSG